MYPSTKSAGVLAAKNIPIFEITETVKWFLSRMCDNNMHVFNGFGIRVHNQIVPMDLQLAVVRYTGKRFLVGSSYSYFLEESNRATVINELRTECHIPLIVASGIGHAASKDYGALKITQSGAGNFEGLRQKNRLHEKSDELQYGNNSEDKSVGSNFPVKLRLLFVVFCFLASSLFMASWGVLS